MNAFHTCYLEISKSALEHNLRFLRDFVREDVRISAVIKGNAYGHGIEHFVPLAESCGSEHFSVFSADEALRVHNCRRNNSTIMIMGAVDNQQLEWAIEHDIEFFVFEMERLRRARDLACKMNKKALVHIELETGMNRTGFETHELSELIGYLLEHKEYIYFKGLCTHFAGAESIANYYRINQQQQNYDAAVKRIRGAGLEPEILHTACSAAAIRYPEMQLDMVRMGIVHYGFFPNREVLIEYMTKKNVRRDPLERLISWKSYVMDVKWVKSGEFIGYGTSYLANSDRKIAVIPVGYSHGFSRSLSNQGRVLIRGQRVSVIGIVNMNMLSVDITRVEGVEKGDEVVLIGRQGELEITVSSFSEFSEQLNYELLTRLPHDLPRIIVE